MFILIVYSVLTRIYQSSKYTEKTAESDVVVVEFVNGIEFKQTTLKKFDILLGSAADIKAEDVAIDEVVVGPTGEYRVSTMIKGVTMSADKKTATVEVFYDLKDGVSYEVSVKGYDKQTLVASAGKPVAMTVYAKDVYGGQVSIGKMTELAYTLIDANGVDVTTGTDAEKNKVVFNLKYVGKSGANYEMSYYAGYATFDFTEVGDYAVISGEYATGDFENNVEVKVVAPSITVYGVEKQLVTVQSVVDYTTQTAGWNNFWSANKDVVKLSQTNNLAVKVSLLDGKEVVITKQGETVSDYEGVTHGYVTVETTNSSKDYLDLDAVAGEAITLRPRKVGVAQLMVYYNVNLPDGSVQKSAVAPITIKVKEAPVLNAIGFNYAGTAPATVIVSINPEADHNDLRYVWNNYQLLDQYGDTYTNIESVELAGNNQAAQDLVDNGGLTLQDGGNYQVATPKFQAKIHEMNATAINQDKISGKFYFTIKAKDAVTKAVKTNTIVVDVRGLSDNEIIGTDLAQYNYTNSTTSGNIARVEAGDPWNARAEKFVNFVVFDKQNGANVDHREIAPYHTITDINAASDGYYFKVFKDNSDITKTCMDAGLIVFDGDNSVRVRFSGEKIDGNGMNIVSYDNVGAGTYQFVLYKVEPSRYNPAIKVASQVSSAAKTVTVSCDPGKYTLTGRDAVIIYNVDGKVPATVSSLDLLKCFNFANRGNNAFQKNPWDGNTETQANFGGNMVDYVVTLNNELQRPNSVYVDYVTFYEKINNTETYVAYKVDVKCFVEYRAAQ